MLVASGGFMVTSLPGGPCVQAELTLPYQAGVGGTITLLSHEGTRVVELDPAIAFALAEAFAEVIPGVPTN